MAQFARPSYDVSNTGWTATGGLDLYTAINDVVVDDNDFIRAQTGTCEVGLGAVLSPISQAGHSCFFRTKMVVPYLSAPLLQVFLYCGATLIKASPNLDMSLYLTFTDFTISLSEGEAGTISDYSDLRLRFVITPGIGGYTVDVSQAYFECPDGASGGYTVQAGESLVVKHLYDRKLNHADFLPKTEHVPRYDRFGNVDNVPWRYQPLNPSDARNGMVWGDFKYPARACVMVGGRKYPKEHAPRKRDADFDVF